jgi:hypothetical protein
MTKSLERVFAEVSKLSPQDQDAVAAWLENELESERDWDLRFHRSANPLARLANEALAEDDAGMTRELDPDRA